MAAQQKSYDHEAKRNPGRLANAQNSDSLPLGQAGNNGQNHQSDEIVENGSAKDDLTLPILKMPQVRSDSGGDPHARSG